VKKIFALSYCIVRICVYEDCVKNVSEFLNWRFAFGVANSSN